MRFFSKLNNFSHYPKEMNYFSIKEFEVILDLIMIQSYSKMLNTGVKKPSMRQFLSCVVAFNEEHCVIGITDDKTTPGNAFLMGINKSYCIGKTNDELVSMIEDTAVEEYGAHFKWFTKFSYKTILENKLFFEEAFEMDTFSEVMNILISKNEYKNILIELQKASEELVKNIIVREKKIMNFNPIFKARNLTIDENMVFCVLPFNDERLEIFDEVLKPKLEQEFGLTVVRSGNIFEPNQNLTETIWTYINQSKFVIADISDKNANVFYELGICHTIGKPVISICDEESLKNDYNDRLPFDIGAINTIFYKNKGIGMEKLFENIKLNIQSVIEGKPIIK